MMWNKHPKPDEVLVEDIEEEEPTTEPSKRYIAVVGVNLDDFKARYSPGDEIPMEYLQGIPKHEFDWLLRKQAIKEVAR